MSPSDSRTWRAFVKVADTLVADFDIIEFLAMLAEYGVELLGVSACGILLADPDAPGDPDHLHLWAGQAFGSAADAPAGEVIEQLRP